MHAPSHERHTWLRQLLGEWKAEGFIEGDKQSESDWTESVRAIGELWIVAEGGGTMPDGNPGTMMITLGYDPERQRYVGTWIGSMMTHMWHYDGHLDATGRVLTLESEGPDWERPGQTLRSRDIIELEDAESRLFRTEILGQDGTWREMMRMRYRRVA
jgi:hypothetical protein